MVETIHESKVIILWDHQGQTDRTIPNNKPDIKIHDEKGTCKLIDVTVSGERYLIKKEAEILNYEDLNSRHTAYTECKNKSDTTNKRGNWNHFKIIPKKPEQHISTRKTWNQGTTKIRHTGHCTCSRNGIGEHGLDWSGSRYEKVAGTCKCGNEPSGSIKYGEFLG